MNTVNQENPAVQLTATSKLLDALPGLVGAVDRAFVDVTGNKTAFILVAFAEGQAVHATNINPPSDAIVALKELMKNWDTSEGGTVGAAGGVSA